MRIPLQTALQMASALSQHVYLYQKRQTWRLTAFDAHEAYMDIALQDDISFSDLKAPLVFSSDEGLAILQNYQSGRSLSAVCLHSLSPRPFDPPSNAFQLKASLLRLHFDHLIQAPGDIIHLIVKDHPLWGNALLLLKDNYYMGRLIVIPLRQAPPESLLRRTFGHPWHHFIPLALLASSDPKASSVHLAFHHTRYHRSLYIRYQDHHFLIPCFSYTPSLPLPRSTLLDPPSPTAQSPLGQLNPWPFEITRFTPSSDPDPFIHLSGRYHQISLPLRGTLNSFSVNFTYDPLFHLSPQDIQISTTPTLAWFHYQDPSTNISYYTFARILKNPQNP